MTEARIGLVGLGVMGANLALNIAEKGYPVAVHNRTTEKIQEFVFEAGDLAGSIVPAETAEALASALRPPRAIIIMVKAGEPVDAVIAGLLPHLESGDMLIDAGNADFNDTRRREAELEAEGIHYLGMGVSGGEEGARHGPSIMVGGDPRAYGTIRDIVEAIAAKYQDDPCAALVGPDGAGHFVKTVHNGIEYADMQLIAEVYGLLRDGEGMKPAAIGELFREWNGGPLQSFLVEITAKVLAAQDADSGGPLVDVIRDSAGQKGTGRWTVIEALRLGQSASTIEAAVGARSWSALDSARAAGADRFRGAGNASAAGAATHVLEADLERALLAARVVTYGQGFALLDAASREYGWEIDLARVAEIWRAGCIIRSALLDDIARAIRTGLPEGQMILSDRMAEILCDDVAALRRVAVSAIARGLPVPAMSAALSFFDSMRQARGTANLIQAQRDFFGAHGFERIDRDGSFHGSWHRD